MKDLNGNAGHRPTDDNGVNKGSEEETLVIDSRSVLTPSQLVEQKLIGRLKASPLLISQIQRQLKPGPR